MDTVVNKIVDIHSHILPGIDDGARSFKESIEILDLMKNKGITDIVCTPHYMKSTKYNQNNKEKIELFHQLKQQYQGINLYLGNEVYIDEDICELLKKEEILTINNSAYLLIELPMNSKIKDLDSIFYDLMRKGIIPLIAHPERYSYVQEDITYLDEYINMGVLFQGNYESLFGKYGKSSEKTLKKLLKKNYITCLGSDIHRFDHENHTEKLYKKLLRIVKNEKKVKELVFENAMKILENKEIK